VPKYEQNLITHVRREFKPPNLPVVIGELTGPWVDAPGEWETLRNAQAAAAARPEFKGTVLFVPTRDFVRPAKESPNPTHGHHEFGNAETYFLVGDALGKGMVKLLTPRPDNKPAPEPTKKPEVPPKKSFKVDGHAAFVIMPARTDGKKPVPWVWHAPTFPSLPEAREHWMFEMVLAAGIAGAGVDVGQSYGSPRGARSLFAAPQGTREAAEVKAVARSYSAGDGICAPVPLSQRPSCLSSFAANSGFFSARFTFSPRSPDRSKSSSELSSYRRISLYCPERTAPPGRLPLCQA
jgi:hypothetical protein